MVINLCRGIFYEFTEIMTALEKCEISSLTFEGNMKIVSLEMCVLSL